MKLSILRTVLETFYARDHSVSHYENLEWSEDGQAWETWAGTSPYELLKAVGRLDPNSDNLFIEYLGMPVHLEQLVLSEDRLGLVVRFGV